MSDVGSPPPDTSAASVAGLAQSAEDRRTASQRQRRQELKRQQPAIEKALRAYREIDSPDTSFIRIRTEFIRTDDPRRSSTREKPYSLAADVETRPPMTRLVDRRRHSLRLLLTAFFVARMTTEPGKEFVNVWPNMPKRTGTSWLTLSGLQRDVSPVQRRSRRRMFNTALDGLAKHSLVALQDTNGANGRYQHFSLLDEGGRGAPYKVPGDDLPAKAAISIPTDFFRQGWHLVLTDHELVTYLAVIDRTGYLSRWDRSGDIRDLGVDLKKSVRYPTYGISDEAYTSVHQLHQFGLIEVEDPMPNRWNPRPHFPRAIAETGAEDLGGDGEKEEPLERLPYRLIYPPREGAIFPPAPERVLGFLPQ